MFVVAVVPSIIAPTLMCRPPDPQLDDLGTLPAFTLTDETGAPFTEAALRGQATIVSFIFTRCDTICPVTSLKMERVQDKTFDAGARVKLLSISVDPGYDTPARLAEYARRFHADPKRWHFITGPADAVKTLVEGHFANSMQREGDTPSGAPNIAHNGHFALVDADLKIRGFYDSREIAKLDELMRDARYLARTQYARGR